MINNKSLIAALLLCTAPAAHADIPGFFSHTINAIGEGISSRYNAMSNTMGTAMESSCTNSKFLLINDTDTAFSIEAIESSDNGTLTLTKPATQIPAHSSVMGILKPQTWSHGNASGVMSLKNRDGYLEIVYSYHSNFGRGSCTPTIVAKSHASEGADQYTFLNRQYEGSPAFASLSIEHDN